MRPERAFDAFFADDGGAADLSDHPAAHIFEERRTVYRRYLKERIEQLATQGVHLAVHFDFVDSPDINAAAGQIGDQSFAKAAGLGMSFEVPLGARRPQNE